MSYSPTSNRSYTGEKEREKALRDEALKLQLEMARIKERQRLVDEQTRRLKSESSRMLSPAASSIARGGNSSARRSASAGSRMSNNSGFTNRNQSSMMQVTDPFKAIESEKERRQKRTITEQLEMKNHIRRALDNDSTLVGGFFLPKDNPKSQSISRAPRFRQIVGMKGQYYLDNDVSRMQKHAKQPREYYSCYNRGQEGANVTCQWNTAYGGTAPGPGAYTPRYQKTTKSVLA